MLNGDGDSPLGLGKDLAPSSVSNPHMKGLRQRLVEQDILLGPPESAHTDTFSTHTHALSHRRTHTEKSNAWFNSEFEASYIRPSQEKNGGRKKFPPKT